MNSHRCSGSVVSIDEGRIRLLSEAYNTHFQEDEAVRLGTHQRLPLIYIQPTAPSDETHSISHRPYSASISCLEFLQANNFHHTESHRYCAQWIDEVGALVVDLSDPVFELQHE